MSPDSGVLLRRSGWHDAARLLKQQNPDISYAEIGRLLGVTGSAVMKALNPDRARAYNQRGNHAPGRQEAKNRWGERDRNENRVECSNPACTNLRGLMGPTPRKRPGFCVECIHAIAEVRRTLAEGMWADGWPLRDMGAAFGGVDHRSYFAAARDRGWNLPYRYRNTKRQRVAANV